MQPLQECGPEILKQIKVVLCDIDELIRIADQAKYQAKKSID